MEKPKSNTQLVQISRKTYTQDAVDESYAIRDRQRATYYERVQQSCTCSKRKAWKILTTYLPVIKFTRSYKIREYLLGDFLSGLTVSFMHLPQAMGFGILASLTPVHGLYSTFFAVLFYLLLGTSPYISFGTNAVMALLTQTAVEREADAFISSYSGTSTGNNSDAATGPADDEILNVKVGTAMACSFLAGVFLMGMGILRLGFLTTYLSVSFVGGFTTAAAIHIASSQVPKALGISVKAFSGPGKLVRMYIDLFSKIETTNVAELVITIICMIILLLVKICINERYKQKMKMPVPIDLIVVIVGTIISHFGKLDDKMDVKTVGPIPKGLPTPQIPKFENASNFIADAIVMGILSLAMSISMAKLTAKMHGIKINDNQEMIAYGASNLFPSFFHCFPSATAPPRTMILSSLGAKTTLNGIPTAIFMLLVILLIGPLFVSLPLSVLAAMIIVSMKDLLLQYRNLKQIWRINKYDFIIWIVTNAVSVLVDLDYGLIAGIGVSVFLVVIQSQLASGSVLALSRSEDLLLDASKNEKVFEIRGVKIFKFSTGLFFATVERFKSQLYKAVLNPQIYKKQMKKLLNKDDKINVDDNSVDNKGGTSDNEKHDTDKLTNRDDDKIRAVILDCASMNYMDIGGVNMLQQIIKEYGEIGITVYIAGLPKSPRKSLAAAGFFDKFPKDRMLLDVFDAIELVRSDLDLKSTESWL